MSLDQDLPQITGELFEALPPPAQAAMKQHMAPHTFDDLCEQHVEGLKLPDGVRMVLPDADEEQVDKIVREMVRTQLKNSVVDRLLRSAGPQRVADFVNLPDVEKMRALGGAILAFWHTGPRLAMVPSLERIGIPALALAMKTPNLPMLNDKVKYLPVSGSTAERAAALKRSIEHLQSGGLIAAGVDGAYGDQLVRVSFLGRWPKIGRGAAVMTRLTGAPIVPVTLSWGEPPGPGWRIDFTVYDPIEPGDNDEDTMQRVVDFFDAYTREHLDQYRPPRLLTMLTRAPTDRPESTA